MYTVKDYPEFSWSSSRHDMFELCERKYFYHYYGSHRGWENNAPNHKIYALKNLTNLHLVFGEAVHAVIKEVLYNFVGGTETPRGYIDGYINNALRRACKVSKKDWWTRPGRNHYLMEVAYYGGFKSKMGEGIVKTINEKKKSVEEHFYSSKTYQEISSGDIAQVLEIDEDLSNEETSRFKVEDTTVFAKVDFLYRRKSDGKTVIVDWKTDRSIVDKTTHNRQLGIYAYYVNRKYGVDVKDMVLRVESLVEGTNIEIPFTDKVFADVERFVVGSIERMKSLVVDGNTFVNRPKKAAEFIATEDRSECKTCKFRALCFPEWK